MSVMYAIEIAYRQRQTCARVRVCVRVCVRQLTAKSDQSAFLAKSRQRSPIIHRLAK